MGVDKTKLFLFSDIESHQTFFSLKECEIPRKKLKENIVFVDFLNNSQTKAYGPTWKNIEMEKGKYEIIKIIITVIVWEQNWNGVERVKDDDENDSNKTLITN